jgi:hypothetical protein
MTASTILGRYELDHQHGRLYGAGAGVGQVRLPYRLSLRPGSASGVPAHAFR